MPRRFKGRLNNREVIDLLKRRIYRIEGERVQTRKDGKWQDIHHYRQNGYTFVRLYHEGKRRAIAVHSLVWMSHTHFPIPHRFEVHHRNGEKSPNTFDNLMCIHRLDHEKFHEEQSDADIPF